MACRFPGADGLSAFWRQLEEGENAVTEGIPGSGVGRVGDLFAEATEKDACRFGAFVSGIDLFDSEFFRISPIEAQLLDPQQRMMLETSWQALEDAGIDPASLKGGRVGVYAGISNMDYRNLILESGQTSEPAASLYSVTGSSLNTAIGRVAFVLGLEGPAMSVDTACSSSLVALHQASVALQRGEADLALAGGVQAVLTGRLTELRAAAGMLSPDGQCKAFDAAANGFVRGEGCGIVVLKRLSEARADGDRIWGVIVGSAVNQDGTSPGFTVPSERAQIRVIEEALSKAGLSPLDVDYVEAHGTGTQVGDPIEIRAAAAAYGKGRDADCPLLIGSVKTNIGHLEPAAGIAGLIKAVLAMNRGMIPKHLHFRNPNPDLDWDRLPLEVTSATTEWPLKPDRSPRAGVNSFGWSGTNAHVLVEGAEAPESAHAGSQGVYSAAGPPRPVTAPALSLGRAAPLLRQARVLPLSGRTEDALRDLAGQYLSWLDEHDAELREKCKASDPALSDMAWTASVGRSHFNHRAGVVFRNVGSLRECLRALTEVQEASEGRECGKVAFVYTGQASQWVGMGHELYESEPAAREVLDRCDRALLDERGISLLDVMFGSPGLEADLDDPGWTQPAIYALECALTAAWSGVGIRPAVVMGHSLGEIAAAQAAGVLSLEDGVRFAAARGVLMARLPEPGAMAALFAPEERVAEAVAEQNAASDGPGLSIAAYNGAHQVVSGPVATVEGIAKRFEQEEIRVRRLRSGAGYHSALVEPALEDLEAIVKRLEIRPPSLALVSNVTAQLVGPDTKLDEAYWRRHAREPVAFSRSVARLAEIGVDVVIELGPHRVLGPMAALAWSQLSEGNGIAGGRARPPAVIQSLVRASSDGGVSRPASGFAEAVAAAYEAGLAVSFAGLFAGETRRRISLPTYPFQRRRHWLDVQKRRRGGAGHPLLGDRHESPHGEVLFETQMFLSDSGWLTDHRVFGRVVAPGALYGAMAVSAALAARPDLTVVDGLQLHRPLAFPEQDSEADLQKDGRRVQVVLGSGSSVAFEIFSKGRSEEDWTLHAEGQLLPADAARDSLARVDPASLTAGRSPANVAKLYRAKAEAGIDLGPSFRSLRAIWPVDGGAVGEVALPEEVDLNGLEVHPVLLDGCFQVLSAARNLAGGDSNTTYMPFGWERLWLAGPLPDRFFCHAQAREAERGLGANAGEAPEVLIGDLWLYASNGEALGTLHGVAVKRATRAALISAVGGLQDLLYEVVWRNRELEGGTRYADFLARPAKIPTSVDSFQHYLASEGVTADERAALLTDMERLSQSYALAALEELGWERKAGLPVEPDRLRRQSRVLASHRRLFERLLGMLAEAGVLQPGTGSHWAVAVGPEQPLPDESLRDPDQFAAMLVERHSHGSNELGLLRRCGAQLAEVLRGRSDPLALLFSHEPGAADLYRTAPASRAANQMLGEAVGAAISALPEGRRLRVLEVGAGTGSATASVLSRLPSDRLDYVFTDVSAGFFAKAETRFADSEASIEYRSLDIERDPSEQGFDSHAYDLVIAANVLHATKDLGATLSACRELLVPSGQLVALEGLKARGWQDLTFGLLDGWWRFADSYRTTSAMVGPSVWRHALRDAGFEAVAILGATADGMSAPLGSGVIVAQGPKQVRHRRGIWVMSGAANVAAELATELVACNQTVILATEQHTDESLSGPRSEVRTVVVDAKRRESWCSLLTNLPGDAPLQGVVHLGALEGHGANATTEELAADITASGASALALVQGLADTDTTPTNGVWFVTRGAQVLECERGGELSGATVWGFGRSVAREASHLRTRIVDLDPSELALPSGLVNELLFPDSETQIAYRAGKRHVARLVRGAAGTPRLTLPEGPDWRLGRDPSGQFHGVRVEPLPRTPLSSGEVRIAVEAAGLNFTDVLAGMRALDYDSPLGREICGRITETAPDVVGLSAGDRVVGLGFHTFGGEVVTRSHLVAPAPSGMPAAALATIPTAFTTAALAFQIADLGEGERVLIHAGSGGVGLAAIQLARATGAEIFATASIRKQAYLRSIGVARVFDSRQTRFGEEVLKATRDEGVHVVLNSLTGPGFIEASLSCLRYSGRFVEIGRRDIWSEEAMSSVRPDVAYSVLALDALKREDPRTAGAALAGVMERLSSGDLTPLVHSRWPIAEAGEAMAFMRSARHIGKIVLTMPPLVSGGLRRDRTYLVTGGLGGIGLVVAGWLAGLGAGAIVLNGRRAPDSAAEETIARLREGGVRVAVELADVTDPAAIDQMLARIEATQPPLGGVIHSVGVLSDGSLANQTWNRFERVLWPKVLGAWHLHRATAEVDLDLFVLFSSVVGVLGKAGQANHAAANAFLDQLARHRRAVGLAGQAIAWGAWSGLGEAEEQRARISRQLEAAGSGWITSEQGLEAFDQLVRKELGASMVASVDWPVLAGSLDVCPPLLEDLLSDPERDTPGAQGASDDLLSELTAATVEQREALLAACVQRELQAVLRLQEEPALSRGFFELGMDSLMAVELRNRVNRALPGELTISSTAVFDYPDAASLARHLAQEFGEADDAAGLPEPRVPQARPADGPGEDAIAIVGMACRFPGAPDLSAFWDLLEAGRDAVTSGRQEPGPWRGVTGDPSTGEAEYRTGGFIEGIDRFDSQFFGISPIEARMMDPRQRLLLETSWLALEDAGIVPGRLAGSRAGIYVGVGGSEYRDLIVSSGRDEGYVGTVGSVTVERVAFTLGLTGPAMPVDVACASALVAVHQGIASLQRGEVDLAMAGGVHAILSHSVTRFLTETAMLSPSGRCRSFDASADGLVRGEGCGVAVLKRLRDAQADGDRIWGVIRGSAVNRNFAGAGMTAPNGPSQERVIEEALSRAGIPPSEVDYLEAHGTASELGDPIEVQAASAIYGKGRGADRPLLIGTVKSNIGHLGWAAGIAGLIKVVLSMRRGLIPRQLHLQNPNPHIDWHRLPVEVTTSLTEWPQHRHRPPRAGISAFGLFGTNAHLIVEGYEDQGDAPRPHRGSWPAGPARRVAVSLPELSSDGLPDGGFPRIGKARILPLSGKSDQSLRELEGRYRDWLSDLGNEPAYQGSSGDSALADIAWTAGVGRSHFPYRFGVVFHDFTSLEEGLRDLAEGSDGSVATKVAFAYTGADGCWAGMGKDLYESEPVARAILNRCDDVLRDERTISLLDVMFGRGESDGNLADPAWAEPAAYALHAAVAALWSSVGVQPSAAAGHGAGEVSAALAAGVLDLEGGLLHAAARGELVAALADGASQATLDGLEMALDRVESTTPVLPMVSSVTGRVVESKEALDGAYWSRQARRNVTFDNCVNALAAEGAELVIQIGPHPRSGTSTGPAPASAVAELGNNRMVLLPGMPQPSGNPSSSEQEGFVQAVARAYEAGLPILFDGLFAGESRRRVSLPGYPFERRQHWV